MRYVENGTIEDNIILYTRTGVLAEGKVYNTTISNNIIISDHTGKVGGKGIHISSDSHNITVLDNKILNHYLGMQVELSSDILVDNNFVENTIWEDFAGGNPIALTYSNYSILRRNVLAGAFAQGTFRVDQENCVGNVIEHNYATTDESIAFDFNITFSSGSGELKLAGSPPGLIGLSGSNYNYIGYNVSLVDSLPSRGLPINVIILIIGIISIVAAVVAITLVVREKKRE